MAVTFAGAGSTETPPGGCECASRAGEGERGERQPDSPGRCQFILMAFDDVMTPEVLSGSHKLC
jgi:hypothetical protein